jgi:hypothetical protein
LIERKSVGTHPASACNYFGIEFTGGRRFTAFVSGTKRSLAGWLIAFFAAAALTGCVSHSKSQAQARQAFLAGQRAALLQAQQQQAQSAVPSSQTVTIVGSVRNPVVGWVAGLTLSRAIVYAGYNARTDPVHIIIHRTGQEIDFDPKRLLSGDDFPLEAGDVVEIRQ